MIDLTLVYALLVLVFIILLLIAIGLVLIFRILINISKTATETAKQVDVIDRQTYKRPSRKILGG